MADRIPIVLGRCGGYDRAQIKSFCERAAARLALPAAGHGATVLLKPNLISSRAPNLACSDGRFVRAVAEWFVDRGARVMIGDSPSFGSAVQVLQKQGIAAELAGLDHQVVEFRTPVQYRLSHGVSVGIAAEIFACDLLVNLPRIKAHSQMYVTLAVKNLFGVVCGMRKAVCHMKNGPSHRKFGDLMLDLHTVVPDSVTFIDGIEAMHRQGPVHGDLLELGCLGAGRDPVALDTALLEALQLDRRKCPVWRAAEARGYGGAAAERLHFPEAHPEDFHGSGFRAPAILNPVPFNPFRFLKSSFRRAVAAAGG